MSIESVMPSDHLILCHPFPLLPSIFPGINVFSYELALCIRWPKYWSFSFTISPSNEYAGLISFKIDWFDLLAVQGTLKSLFQHHGSKASILWCSAFFNDNTFIFPIFLSDIWSIQVSHFFLGQFWKDFQCCVIEFNHFSFYDCLFVISTRVFFGSLSLPETETSKIHFPHPKYICSFN